MPTVVLEAMASGTRVVGSAVDGIPDVIRHSENGWLCRQKDARDLAEKILTALEDSPSSRVIERALETADRFDVAEVAARYANVFEHLLSGRPAVMGNACGPLKPVAEPLWDRLSSRSVTD